MNIKKVTFVTNLISSAILLSFGCLAKAEPINFDFQAADGSMQKGSNNFSAMSKSGRYVPFNSMNKAPLNNTNSLYVRDLKTQTTTTIHGDTYHELFSISSNGRYLAFYRKKLNSTEFDAVVLDRVTGYEKIIPAKQKTSIGLSDNGIALFNKCNVSGCQLIRYRISDGAEEVVVAAEANLGYANQPHPLSVDGKIALFKISNRYFIYNAETRQNSMLNPVDSTGKAVSIDSSVNAPIALAGKGNFVAFITGAITASDKPSFAKLDLRFSQPKLEKYYLSNKYVNVRGGISISGDGRYISFKGDILEGHPEWNIANNLENGLSYPRVFRYDTRSDSLVTVSVAYNGYPIASHQDGTGLYPEVSGTSVISDDGSLIEYATGAKNITTKGNESAEANFVALVDNGFARKYQFVDMPNSDNGFKPFAPMTLVGNNTWEGFITFDGVGADRFKFDAGGEVINGVYQGAADWGINFGAGNVAGKAEKNGPDIAVNKGAGTYKITFNDTTLDYSVSLVAPLDRGYDTLRQLADVNGDQIADFCRFVGHFSTAYLSCNLGEGTGFSANQYGFNSIASLDKGYDFFRQMIDVNGDKKADYCRFAGHYPTAFLGCTTAASGGFTAAQYNYRSADGLDKGYDIFRQLADVNGDGFADYCRFVGHYDTAYLSCNLGGLASFTNTRFNSVEGLDKGSDVYRRLVDVNNDKRADYCRFIGPTNTSRLSCNLATATGFSSQITTY